MELYGELLGSQSSILFSIFVFCKIENMFFFLTYFFLVYLDSLRDGAVYPKMALLFIQGSSWAS